MNIRFKAWLQILRPANIITAIADSWAGMIIASSTAPMLHFNGINGLALSLSSACLYGGGVVLNDAFDLETDKLERPERPIPKGLIAPGMAFFVAFALLISGILLAWANSRQSAILALVLSGVIVLYDSLAKKNKWTGPFVMGTCRSLNLLLGISLIPSALEPMAVFGVFPLLYIAAITAVSRGEVHGGRKTAQLLAFFLYATVIMGVFGYGFYYKTIGIEQVGIFLALFSGFVVTPLYDAWQSPSPANIRNAVKRGVIGIIALDACYASLFTGWLSACIILLLMPIAIWVGKKLAVT